MRACMVAALALGLIGCDGCADDPVALGPLDGAPANDRGLRDAAPTSDAGAFDYIEPRRRRTEIAGWTLAGVGVAALASGIALLVLDESGRPPVVLGPVASEGGGGAAVWGRF